MCVCVCVCVCVCWCVGVSGVHAREMDVMACDSRSCVCVCVCVCVGVLTDSVHESSSEHINTVVPSTNQNGGSQFMAVPSTHLVPTQLTT